MENLKKLTSRNTIFWYAGVSLAVSIFGIALHNLKNYIFNDIEFIEEDLIKLDKIKQEIERNNNISIGEAIQLIALIKQKAEEEFENLKQDFDTRRREKIASSEEYEEICKEMFEYKESIYNEVTESILQIVELESIEDIQKILKKIPPFEVERRIYEFCHPYVDEKEFPEIEIAKKAFLYFGKKFKLEIEDFQKIKAELKNKYESKLENEILLFKLLIMKTRVEDKLYMRYSYSESEIRYFLYKYNLYKDRDVKQMHDEISQFDEMITPSE